MTIEARLTTATAVIRDAGALAAKYFAGGTALTRETKGPQDFVSIADREVEAVIRTGLAEAFPTDGLVRHLRCGTRDGRRGNCRRVLRSARSALGLPGRLADRPRSGR